MHNVDSFRWKTGRPCVDFNDLFFFLDRRFWFSIISFTFFIVPWIFHLLETFGGPLKLTSLLNFVFSFIILSSKKIRCSSVGRDPSPTIII